MAGLWPGLTNFLYAVRSRVRSVFPEEKLFPLLFQPAAFLCDAFDRLRIWQYDAILRTKSVLNP